MKNFFLLTTALFFAWQNAQAKILNPPDVSSVNEDSFTDLLNKIEDEFTDDLDVHDRQLAIIPVWKNNEFSAVSTLDGEFAVVTVNGGLARQTKMTMDTVALVVCREVGHFLGGAPLAQNGFSAEGEADYFATTKCLRRVFQDEPNVNIVAAMDVDPEVAKTCESAFAAEADIAICVREITAAVILTNIYKTQHHDPTPARISTPDLTRIEQTNQSTLPNDQCRLDTFYQGAICNKSVTELFSNINIKSGACNAEAGDLFGYRPSCWYNPYSVFVAGDLFLY